MKKKDMDTANIIILEGKIEEIKNKIILNYMNSLMHNENNAINENKKLNKEVTKDKKKIKKVNKQLKVSKLTILLGYCLFSIMFLLSIGLIPTGDVVVSLFVINVFSIVGWKIYTDEANKEISALKKHINENEEIISKNDSIIKECKTKVVEMTKMNTANLFRKLENELISKYPDMVELFTKYEQIISEFNKKIEKNKENFENHMHKPFLVNTIDVLYEASFDKVKEKSLQLKK